ncbi:hypothetical protein FD04_GL002124 [Secundilactobacillus odoratitofui DSM 19909 = JCM 15043]|uniref:Competence protein ComGF n=1 Tax=Secundilactobacillus odoratitofui DSM 19909 = JCM 15043 TaxID=1423776 RepID=A0A0R1LMZ1_9LACO|nr:competence type IV pilus minor pilin ComGF [Secundilactobacillus odoratitofui]KRK97262.1 hypothetical protein FD04_GL002124 [Secundilactobacillus odoratitofui DSM 19909 = JCM 15043]
MTSIAIVSIQFGLQMLNGQSQQRAQGQLAWYYLLGEIESKEYHFSLTQVNKSSVELKQAAGKLKGRRFILAGYKEQLILTTFKGGYLPVMRQVVRFQFREEHHHLRIMVTTKQGQQFSALTSVEVPHEKS